MAKQIYPLTFKVIELNHLMLEGLGVLNTPLGPDYLRRLARITVDEYSTKWEVHGMGTSNKVGQCWHTKSQKPCKDQIVNITAL